MTQALIRDQAERKYDTLAQWFEARTAPVDEHLGERVGLVALDYLEWCFATLTDEDKHPVTGTVARSDEMAVFLLACGHPIAMPDVVTGDSQKAASLLGYAIVREIGNHSGVTDLDPEGFPELFLMGRILTRQWPVRDGEDVDNRLVADSSDSEAALHALAALPPRMDHPDFDGLDSQYGARVVDLSDEEGYVHVQASSPDGGTARDFVLDFLLSEPAPEGGES